MKYLLTATLLLLLAAPALAETVTIEYPQVECNQIIGSDLSAPAGDSMYYLFELHCRNQSGTDNVFIVNWASAASLFGFSRAGIPDQISLVPGNEKGLVVRD